MFKKLALIFIWFLATPSLLVISTVALSKYSQNPRYPPALSLLPDTEIGTQNGQEGQVLGTKITDMRPYQVANLLKNTQLEPYSLLIVGISDKYGIDYRLIPAIAMKESGGGNKARPGSHNAWGFENGRTNFDSWEAAIETVGKTLKERYVAKGLVTPEQIMPVYAPPQIASGGKWAKDVNYFFSKIESL
jgi:hypothetical protein